MNKTNTCDKKAMHPPSAPCPCNSGNNYQQCCHPLHTGSTAASTPEQLMRARYSAFSTGNAGYLQQTHHPSKRTNNTQALTDTINNTQWLGLRIIKVSNGATKSEGYVEFIAHYNENEQIGILHEKSRFVFENNHWFYIDGEIIKNGTPPLPGRNEPCWCGSTKKFKKCHG